MATLKDKKAKKDVIDIVELMPVREATIEVIVIGTQPLIYNAVSEKARRELLLPRGNKLNATARATKLKHDPEAEYRDSVYRWATDEAPTRLRLPATSFKAAICAAALRTPGIFKTEIGQQVWVRGEDHFDRESVAIYGRPQIRSDVVRMADAKRTPDIRTRACLREWCCKLQVSFAAPFLTQAVVVNLLQTAGMLAGVGDFRQEKGKGSYGLFSTHSPMEKQAQALFHRIASGGHRLIQDEALLNPEEYDEDTRALLEWFKGEIQRRGRSDMLRDA